MDYNDFKEIIKHLKKTLPCGECGKRFPDEGIQLVASIYNDCLFHFRCPHCKNEIVAEVSILDQDRTASKLNIQTHEPEYFGQIDHDDVLDIHNFLKRFDGDFKKLFSI